MSTVTYVHVYADDKIKMSTLSDGTNVVDLGDGVQVYLSAFDLNRLRTAITPGHSLDYRSRELSTSWVRPV